MVCAIKIMRTSTTRLQEWFLVLFVCLPLLPRLTSATCKDDLDRLVEDGAIELIIPENTPADTLVLNVSSGDSLSVDTSSAPFLKVVDGKVYTTRNMTVDGSENKDFCETFRNTVVTFLRCKDEGGVSNIQALLLVDMEFHDDYPIELAFNDSFHVKEQASDVLVVDPSNLEEFVKDNDCNTQKFLQIFQNAETEPYFRIDTPGYAVWVKKALDYEFRRQYIMNVTATSQLPNNEGVPVHSQIVINVDDVDDQDPVFDRQVYTLNITENNENFLEWMTTQPPLIAKDGDTSIDAALEYSIVSSNPQLNAEISENGTIRIAQSLDREKVEAYTIIVKAQQVDNSLASATATVSITVKDMNDNRARFPPQQVTSVTVSEGARQGSHVAWLLAQDGDEGENAEFAYSIHEDTGAFEVVKDSTLDLFELVVKNSALLEGLEDTVVQIRLTEAAPINGGDPCDFLTTCGVNISVTVEDVNDHKPVFTKPRYDLTITSDQVPDTLIETVEAEDADRGANAEVFYSLTVLSGEGDPDCGKISVNSTSGGVSIRQTMIAGVTCYYSVQACDNPSAGNRKCGIAALVLTVLQADSSNSTTDEVVLYDAHVSENLPPGATVMILPINGLFTENNNFTIDGKFLKTAVELDREMQPTHIVLAGERNGTQITEVLQVTVYVDNVNDNSPLFARGDYEIRVADGAEVGQNVLKVEALDADGPDDNVTYSLLNMRDIFTIDSMTGQISLNKSVLQIPTGRSDLLVQAADSGIPTHTTTARIQVYFPSKDGAPSVLVPVGKDTLIQDRSEVESKLSKLLGVSVDILRIESIGSVQSLGSKIYLVASSEDDTDTTSATELETLITQKAEEIHDTFSQAYGNPGSDNDDGSNDDDDDDDDNDFPLAAIILLCVAILLFIIIVVLVVLFHRARRQYQRELSLLKKLNTDTSIYDRAPLYPDISTSSNGSLRANAINNNNKNGSSSNGNIGGQTGDVNLVAFYNQAFVTDEEDDDQPYSRIFDRPESGSIQPNGSTARGVVGSEILTMREAPLATQRSPEREANGENRGEASKEPVYSQPRSSRHHGPEPVYKTTIDVVYPRHGKAAGSPAAARTMTTFRPIDADGDGDVDGNWSLRRNSKLGLQRSQDTSNDGDGGALDGSDDKIASPTPSRLGLGSIKAGSESDSGLPSDRDLQLDEETDQETNAAPLSLYPSLPTDVTTTRSPHLENRKLESTARSSPTGYINTQRQRKSPEHNSGDALLPPEPEPDYEKRVRFDEAKRRSDLLHSPMSPTAHAPNAPETIGTDTEITAL